MMILEAPYPLYQTACILPNPQVGDTESLQIDINYKQTLDGTRYSTVSGQDYLLTYRFTNLTKHKATELMEFFNVYCDKQIRLTDYINQQWLVLFDINTLEYVINRLTLFCGQNASGCESRSESGELTLNFRGSRL